MPPPMAGFIEFALMRTRGDIDQKYLSELYYQYMNVEEDFIKDLFLQQKHNLDEFMCRNLFCQEIIPKGHKNWKKV